MANIHLRHFKIYKNIVYEKKNGPKFSIDTLNENVDNAKSFQWKCFILQFAAQKNFPREYFLAADRGDVYPIYEGHNNLKSFITLLLIQK